MRPGARVVMITGPVRTLLFDGGLHSHLQLHVNLSYCLQQSMPTREVCVLQCMLCLFRHRDLLVARHLVCALSRCKHICIRARWWSLCRLLTDPLC